MSAVRWILPAGVYDLAAAVLLRLGMRADEAAYRNGIEKMVNEFRTTTTAAGWAVLWPHWDTKDPNMLPTHIDVAHDPVVPLLSEWIRDGGPVPTYPADGVPDRRPPEPPLLPGIESTTAFSYVRNAGMQALCDSFMKAWRRSQGVHRVKEEDPVADERVRQFRRLADQNPEGLTFADVVECLGWDVLPGDVHAVHAITDALMLRAGGTEPWHDHGHGRSLRRVRWRWWLCLWAMRLSVVFLIRLRRGGADVAYIAYDVRRHRAAL